MRFGGGGKPRSGAPEDSARSSFYLAFVPMAEMRPPRMPIIAPSVVVNDHSIAVISRSCALVIGSAAQLATTVIATRLAMQRKATKQRRPARSGVTVTVTGESVPVLFVRALFVSEVAGAPA